MTVIKCDCCKKEIKESNGSMFGVYILELGRYTRPQDRKKYELCDECASVIYSVLDGKDGKK